MIQFAIFGVMLVCAGVPFWLLTRVMRAGQTGLALSILSVIGATLAVFIFASGRPFGVDPVVAMAIAMLACVPAFLGSGSGMLLGWLLRKRDDQEV